MSEAIKIGTKLVELCKAGKESECLNTLYDANAISVEAMEGPNRIHETLEGIKAKHEWWNGNTIVHSSSVEGPFPCEDKFAVIFDMDVTMKDSGDRMQMREIGVYTVANGKITREEFMYPTQP